MAMQPRALLLFLVGFAIGFGLLILACCGGILWFYADVPQVAPAPAIPAGPPTTPPAEELPINEVIPSADDVNAAPARFQELPSFIAADSRWRAIVIAPDTPRGPLVALARQLHNEDPLAGCYFFNDADGVEDYRNWAVHETWVENQGPKEDPRYPFPYDWVLEHEVAILHLESEGAVGNELRWQLVANDAADHIAPNGAVLATFDTIDGEKNRADRAADVERFRREHPAE